MLYRAFRDSALSAFGPTETEAFFYREAEVPCRHRLPRRLWDRIRWGYRHPATHTEVVETWHVRKPLRMKLVDHGELLASVDVNQTVEDSLTIHWNASGTFDLDDIPEGENRAMEGNR